LFFSSFSSVFSLGCVAITDLLKEKQPGNLSISEDQQEYNKKLQNVKEQGKRVSPRGSGFSVNTLYRRINERCEQEKHQRHSVFFMFA
jgi:hypothetical protein